jgi:hypothetical protein
LTAKEVINVEESKLKNESNADGVNQVSSTGTRNPQKQKRVIVDFPGWMLESLDKEANRVGVTRQSIIKLWLAERLAGETKSFKEKRKVNIGNG